MTNTVTLFDKFGIVYDSGKVIFEEDQEGDHMFIIQEGSVRISKTIDGKEHILAVLGKGDFFGEMGLFDDSARSAWIRTKSECELAEISYTRYRQIVENDTKILFELASQMAARLRKTSQKVGNLAFMDVTGRVARTLIDLSQEPDAMTHPDGMQSKITRQEIGRIVGCSREMVGRVLKNLEEQNLIYAKGKTIVVFGTR